MACTPAWVTGGGHGRLMHLQLRAARTRRALGRAHRRNVASRPGVPRSPAGAECRPPPATPLSIAILFIVHASRTVCVALARNLSIYTIHVAATTGVRWDLLFFLLWIGNEHVFQSVNCIKRTHLCLPVTTASSPLRKTTHETTAFYVGSPPAHSSSFRFFGPSFLLVTI